MADRRPADDGSDGAATRRPGAGAWPFFAASPAASVAAALDLGAVTEGMRVCDLGCGDGELLLAAAARGASVTGVELDPELAARAEARLAAAGVPADIVVGDLLHDPLPAADVYLAYLSPALLQRLITRPGLRAELAGTPVITIAFRVPGLVPNRSVTGSHLHQLPGLDRPRRDGFRLSGLAIAGPSRGSILTYVHVGHPGGPVSVQLAGPAADHLDVLVGRDGTMAPGELAIDLRVAPHADETARIATLSVEGAGSVDIVVTGGATQPGWWVLGGEPWQRLRNDVEANPGGVDLAALVAAHRPGATAVPRP